MARTRTRRRPAKLTTGKAIRLPLRLVVLALVCAFAAVLVVPTLRQQLAHEQQLDQLRQQVQAAKQREEDAIAELKRWDDPAYVQSQARIRLGYGLPGETAYRVKNPEAVPTDEPTPSPSPTMTEESTSELPWYLKLARGLQDATDSTPSQSASPDDK